MNSAIKKYSSFEAIHSSSYFLISSYVLSLVSKAI